MAKLKKSSSQYQAGDRYEYNGEIIEVVTSPTNLAKKVKVKQVYKNGKFGDPRFESKVDLSYAEKIVEILKEEVITVPIEESNVLSMPVEKPVKVAKKKKETLVDKAFKANRPKGAPSHKVLIEKFKKQKQERKRKAKKENLETDKMAFIIVEEEIDPEKLKENLKAKKATRKKKARK